MIWDATRAEMVARLGGSCDAGGDEEDASGIDEAAFVCLMIKVHYLIICPPVRFWLGYVLQSIAGCTKNVLNPEFHEAKDLETERRRFVVHKL